MTGLPDPGRIRIAATLAAGRIDAVTVACDRRRALTPLLARLPLDVVPTAIGRLHGLCALSQQSAAAAALAAAAGREPPEPPPGRLAAERLGELLRACLIDFAARVPPRPAEKEAARAALAGTDPAGALARLGLGPADPPPGSWAARLLADSAGLGAVEPAPPDPLTAADDAAVLAALDRDGDSFAARPTLPGRRPQTGALARAVAAGRIAAVPCDAAARLRARLDEIAAAAGLSRDDAPAPLYFRKKEGFGAPPQAGAGGSPLGESQNCASDWLRAGQLEPGLGFAVVESPRGRLHHLVALDRAGKLARYHILAPTEWAFAPAGPFAAALPGLRLDADADPATAIDRLAALYDPCVARAVTVTGTRAEDQADA